MDRSKSMKGFKSDPYCLKAFQKGTSSSFASVFELREVGVEVEVPLLRLRKDLLEDEDVGVRRVDELALDLGGDDVPDVRQHLAHLVVRVRVLHQPKKRGIGMDAGGPSLRDKKAQVPIERERSCFVRLRRLRDAGALR